MQNFVRILECFSLCNLCEIWIYAITIIGSNSRIHRKIFIKKIHFFSAFAWLRKRSQDYEHQNGLRDFRGVHKDWPFFQNSFKGYLFLFILYQMIRMLLIAGKVSLTDDLSGIKGLYRLLCNNDNVAHIVNSNLLVESQFFIC